MHVSFLLYFCNMEEPITEKIFSLEEIDYTRFWGDNDKILDFVRILFPKLKIIARGDMLKVRKPTRKSSCTGATVFLSVPVPPTNGVW